MLGMVLGRSRKILAKRTFMVPKLEMLLIFIFRRRRGGRGVGVKRDLVPRYFET